MKPKPLLAAAAVAMALAAPLQPATAGSLTREMYDAFQTGQVDRWDRIVAEDVKLNSPAGWGYSGRQTLKGWASEFIRALQPRIDLVDEFEAIDAQGNGRAVLTFNLNWKHVEPFFELKPTGREGTSIESLILTVRAGKVTRVDVADHTLDLASYLEERGWPTPRNIRPEPLVRGIERRTTPAGN